MPSGPARQTHAALAVAAFDFDGTLTRGGSVWRFLATIVGTPHLVRAALPLLWKFVLAGTLGGRWIDEAKESLFRRTLRGLEVSEVAPRAARFGLDHYRRHARKDTRARLEWHRAHGHKIVIVSASPELYVRPVGEELKVDAVVATRLEVTDDGRLSGRYDGGNCRAFTKIESLRSWMTQSSGGGTTYLWAYGNSAGDSALLEAADVGVDTGRLGRLGKLRRFPRLKDLGS